MSKICLDTRIVKSVGTESFVDQRTLFDLQKYILQVANNITPPLGSHFFSADLDSTGDRKHNSKGNSITLDNVSTWINNVLTRYTVDWNVNDLTIDLITDAYSTTPTAKFGWTGENDNRAKVYLETSGTADGTDTFLGLEKYSELGTNDRKDTVLIRANDILLEHLVQGAIDITSTVQLTDSGVVLSTENTNTTDLAGIVIDEDNVRFVNQAGVSYIFPKGSPSDEYDALVDDGTATNTLEFRPTVPSYVITSPTPTEVKLPGTYNSNPHYRLTLTTNSYADGAAIWSGTGTEDVYKIEGMVEVAGVHYPIPYVDLGTGEFATLDFEPGTGVRMRTNIAGLVNVQHCSIYYQN